MSKKQQEQDRWCSCIPNFHRFDDFNFVFDQTLEIVYQPFDFMIAGIDLTLENGSFDEGFGGRR